MGILGVPKFYKLEINRFIHDQTPLSSTLDNYLFDSMKKFYNNFNKNSDNLEHRKRYLEQIAFNMQFGNLQEDIWNIIDNYKADLPPLEEQDESHKVWRLTLHRIDLRNYYIAKNTETGQEYLQIKPPDPDLIEISKKGTQILKNFEKPTTLLNWGQAVFENRENEKYDPTQWREMLSEAIHISKEQENLNVMNLMIDEGGPAYIATVCVKDHWGELNPEEKNWCRELLLSMIELDKDNVEDRCQLFEMAGNRASARVLPLLLENADNLTKKRVYNAISIGITHAIEEVQMYCADAISKYLWKLDKELASACIAGLIDFAHFQRRSYKPWKKQRTDCSEDFSEYSWKNIEPFRQRISSGEPLEEQKYYRIAIDDLCSAQIIPLIIKIVSKQYDNPLALKLVKQVMASLARAWKHEYNHSKNYEYKNKRGYINEVSLSLDLSYFIVQCDSKTALELWCPIADEIPHHADKVADFFKQFIYAEDVYNKKMAFWAIWEETEKRLCSIPDLLNCLQKKYPHYTRLASILLFDGVHWNDDAKEWDPLDGHANKLLAFFDDYGTSPDVFKSFVKLLDTTGSKLLLPQALISLDNQLKRGNPEEIIVETTIPILDRVMNKAVHDKQVQKKHTELYNAAIDILTIIIDLGSSTAFRLKNFLV